MINKTERAHQRINPCGGGPAHRQAGAGITIKENLQIIKAKRYYYLSISRTKLKNYQAISHRFTVLLEQKHTPLTPKGSKW